MSRRRNVPLGVKLEVALRQLGLDPGAVQLDHHPALGLRQRTPDGGYIPDELDPLAMVWRSTIDHRTKTTGTPPGQKVVTVANGDIHRIAKAKRLEEARLAQQVNTIEGYKPDDPLPAGVLSVFTTAELATRKPWPKGRKMQSRGFARKRTDG